MAVTLRWRSRVLGRSCRGLGYQRVIRWRVAAAVQGRVSQRLAAGMAKDGMMTKERAGQVSPVTAMRMPGTLRLAAVAATAARTEARGREDGRLAVPALPDVHPGQRKSSQRGGGQGAGIARSITSRSAPSPPPTAGRGIAGRRSRCSRTAP